MPYFQKALKVHKDKMKDKKNELKVIKTINKSLDKEVNLNYEMK